MSFILGLTGPTGSGKSSLSKRAEELGFCVIDCDKVARKAAEDKSCKEELSKAFGSDIIDESGNLIRRKLAEKAFVSSDKTELLNNTVFPYIKNLLREEITSVKKEKILLDAPTLYESGMDGICDAVIAVLADKQLMLKRIIKRDNIDKAHAQLRINAGKPETYYREKTPYVIYNNGKIDELYKNFENTLNTIFGG